jgi:pilus assembly protein Flp/PilA
MRRYLLKATRKFGRDERGATAIEYGLIVALIFLAIVASVRSFANTTSDMYSHIESAIINR